MTNALAGTELITIDPVHYVTEVFKPFRSELDILKAEADTVGYDIATTAGMKVATEYRGKFRTVRVMAEKARKERKAPILEIGKLLDSRYRELETELLPFEDRFDSDIKAEEARKEAEKQAKIEAERQRVSDIMERIDVMRRLPLAAVGKLAIEISNMIYSLSGTAPDESYQEFLDQAKTVRFEVLEKLAVMEREQQGIEQAAKIAEQEAEYQRLAKEEADAKLKAEQEAEAARLAAERTELEALRKAQTERDAKAAAERQQDQDKLNAARAQLEADRAELARAQAMVEQAKQDAIDAEQKFLSDWDEAVIWNATLDEERSNAPKEDKPETEKTWSANNEDFMYGSLGELVDNNIDDLIVGQAVYVGDAKRPTMLQLCNAYDVIEAMGDRACEIAGDYADDFPDVSEEAKQELNSLLNAWMEKHCTITFYAVSNVKPYILTAEDLDQEQKEA